MSDRDTPLIITTAVNGAEVTREHNPHIPYTPEEIGKEAARVREAGSSMVHVHGRYDDGTPTQDRDVFKNIKREIEDRTDIIIQFSTGGAVGMGVEERIQALDLEPEMATLNAGTVNFGDEIFENPISTVRTIAKRLKKYGVKPEIEIFHSGMIRTALRLHEEGLIDMPMHFDFVLGIPGGMGGQPEDLEFAASKVPDNCTWSVAGIGKYELPLAKQAIEMGGHVRVGLEDNIYIEKGKLAEGNSELVSKVVEFARQQDRPVATPDIARQILGL